MQGLPEPIGETALRPPPSVWRRLILPVLGAIGLAGAVELAIQLHYRPDFWQKTSWLTHDLYKGELFDRTELFIRLSHLENSEPDIISVGDSSGFFSLQSRIVDRYLDGARFLSLNTGANQAFIGYRAIAEYMLRRSRHIRYVVLYLFPELLPEEGLLRVADLGPITEDDLVSVKSYATPPSAFLSPYLKTWMFKGRRYRAADALPSHVPTLQLAATVADALGWLPEFDVRADRIDGRSPFFADAPSEWYRRLGFGDPSSIDAELGDFDAMVRRYGARLAVAFAPVAARGLVPGDPNVLAAEHTLARFQRRHPDVKFLFPLITRWGIEKFGMFNHVSREYTFLSSERLGRGLRRLLRDPASIPPFSADFHDANPYPAVVAKPLGPPDRRLLAPALALYLEASTGAAAEARLLSARVARLLGEEPAYRAMIADARARAASLAARHIRLGFDLGGLRATPVEVTGLEHCAPAGGVEWVQLDGVITFTYDSPTRHAREPVAWPAGSHIFVPTVVEDGVRKFDGYCPERLPGGASVAAN